MREIKLNQQGKHNNKFIALVDDEDYDYLIQWRWSVIKVHKTYYSIRSEKNKSIIMHRVIMKTPNNMVVDHIDHNGLNCQKINMRNCDYSQSNANRRTWGKRTKYLGVYIDRSYIKAQIRKANKTYHLGLFKTQEEAAIAYDNAAKIYFGEFANLNFKDIENT